MSRFIMSVITAVVVPLFLLLIGIRMASSAAIPRYTTQPPPGSDQATLAAEETLISRFTTEPDLATSLTPYYVEIIARDIARENLTATAAAPTVITPTGEDATTPTATATITPTPTGTVTPAACSPSLAVRMLDEESTALNARMLAAGLPTTTSIHVAYVDHIDGTCAAAPMAFSVQFDIRVEVNMAVASMSDAERGDVLAPMLAAMADFVLPAELRPRRIYLSIVLVHEAGNFFLRPNYYRALEAHTQALSGAALMAFLREPN